VSYFALQTESAKTHINVVRVEVIGDITVDTGPRLERLELHFRLRHVRAVEVEVSKLLSTGSGIVISRAVQSVLLRVTSQEYIY
jgi:hypothetical protein